MAKKEFLRVKIDRTKGDILTFLHLFLFPNIYLPYFFNYIFQKILHNRESKTRYVYHWTVTYYGRQKINLYSNVKKKKKSTDKKEANNSLSFLSSEMVLALSQFYPIFSY